MRSQAHVSFLAFIALGALLGCGDGAAPGSPDPAHGQQDPAGASNEGSGGTTGTSTSIGSAPTTATGRLTIEAAPAGAQCVVVTLTGSTTGTISTTVQVGVSISLGLLNPGQLTVTANAYANACPATGTPDWVGDPVTVDVLAGEAVVVPLVLHAVANGTGTVTFGEPAIAIAAGAYTTYALLADGTLRAWGENGNGQVVGGTLGSTTAAAVSNAVTSPVVVQGISNAIQITAGPDYACVLRSDHSVVCWGDQSAAGTMYQNFSGPGLPATSPTVQSGVQATFVSAGLRSGLSIVATDGQPNFFSGSGTTWGWENIGASQIINVNYGSYYCSLSPEGVASCGGSAGTVYAAVNVYAGLGASANPFSCATTANGATYCWGDNTYGQLGLSGTSILTPTVIPLSGVVSMGLGRTATGTQTGFTAFSCAALQNGTVYCTGSNSNAALGNGSNTSSTTWAVVPGLSGVIAVAAGIEHACALRSNGSVACWGNNDYGQIGDGTDLTRFSPVSVGAW